MGIRCCGDTVEDRNGWRWVKLHREDSNLATLDERTGLSGRMNHKGVNTGTPQKWVGPHEHFTGR